MSVVPVPVLVPNCLAPANLEGAAVVSEVQEEEVAMECLGLMQSLDQGRVGGAEKGADPVPFLPHWQCQASLLHHCSLYSVEWGAQLKRLEDGHPIPAICAVISSMSAVSAWGENMAGTRPGDSAASRQEARSANLMARSSPGAIPRAEEILWLISEMQISRISMFLSAGCRESCRPSMRQMTLHTVVLMSLKSTATDPHNQAQCSVVSLRSWFCPDDNIEDGKVSTFCWLLCSRSSGCFLRLLGLGGRLCLILPLPGHLIPQSRSRVVYSLRLLCLNQFGPSLCHLQSLLGISTLSLLHSTDGPVVRRVDGEKVHQGCLEHQRWEIISPVWLFMCFLSPDRVLCSFYFGHNGQITAGQPCTVFMCSLCSVLLERYTPQLAQTRGGDWHICNREGLVSVKKENVSSKSQVCIPSGLKRVCVPIVNSSLEPASTVVSSASANKIFCRISRCWGLAVAVTDMVPQCCGVFASFRSAVSAFSLRPPSPSCHRNFLSCNILSCTIRVQLFILRREHVHYVVHIHRIYL